MSFQIGRVYHHGLRLAVLGSQTGHHSREDALVAPPFPTVVERFVRPVGGGSIPPPQAIAIDEDNPAQNTSVIPLGTLLGNTLPGSERVVCRMT